MYGLFIMVALTGQLDSGKWKKTRHEKLTEEANHLIDANAKNLLEDGPLIKVPNALQRMHSVQLHVCRY